MGANSVRNCPNIISDSGPLVDIVAPCLNSECKSPLRIKIRFVRRNEREVDLSKFKVEVIKLLPVDITSRVLPFVTREGIDADDVPLPKGRHKLRLTVGDSSGGITQIMLEVKIV